MDYSDTFSKLTKEAIEDLEKLSQPVVRLSGPLTTGGFGYEKNAERFAQAEEILRSKGMTVFSYAKYEEVINKIYEPSMHRDVLELFHVPILKTKLIQKVFFLPRWEESRGANYERGFCIGLGLEVVDFEEGWFPS